MWTESEIQNCKKILFDEVIIEVIIEVEKKLTNCLKKQ